MKANLFTARLAFALALGLAGAGAHARDQGAAHGYEVQLTMKLNGQDVTKTLSARENQPFTVSGKAGDEDWRADFVLNRVRDANANGARPALRLAGTIIEDGKTLAKPTLIGWLGERMGIKVGDDVQLALVVTDQVR